MKRLSSLGAILMSLFLFAACGTVGQDFDIDLAKTIVNGKTTKQEIEDMFGDPYKTGIQNGHPIYVYEQNTYRAFGDDTSKNLIVEFDANGVVRNHQIMSNIPRS